MAVPVYSTDLVDLDTADTTTWVEPTSWTAGTVVSPETDFFIQGSGCAAKYMTSGGTGVGALVKDNGSGVTIPTPGGFFIWICPQGVNQLSNFANGGIRLIVGSSTANFYGWRVAGDDTILYGGWTNWVVDPSAPTPVNDDGTGLDADYQVGTPTGTTQVFGAGVNQQVNAKGGTGFDVMRYGRGELKIEKGSDADGIAVFAGAAALNDVNADTGATTLSVNASLQFTRPAGSFITDGFLVGTNIVTTGFTTPGNNTTKKISAVASDTITVTDTTGLVLETGGGDERMKGGHRWGLFQAIAGGYLYKGLLLFGSATYTVDFRDSNTPILVQDTARVTSDFNTIEIRNVGSRVDWTSVSLLALGTVARGNFTVTDDADVNLTGCTFTDVGLFSLKPNTTALNCTFRRTDKITTGGATLSGCTIDNNRAVTAVLAGSPADAALVSGCIFTSDGTGHGLEITGSPANMTLTNDTWIGYTADSGGNEAVYVNTSAGTMNLNISGGTVPSVRAAAGVTVNVISSVTVTFTGMMDNTEVRVYKHSDGSVVDGIEDATAGSENNRSFAWGAAIGLVVDYVIHSVAYETIRVDSFTVPGSNTSLPIQQRRDRNYENP